MTFAIKKLSIHGERINKISPMTSVQLCSCDGGIQRVVLVQVEVIMVEGRNPSLHQKVTVAPSLV